MAVPARMNLVPGAFKKLLPAAQQTMDTDFQEPRTGAAKQYGPEIPIRTQIVWGQRHRRNPSATGDPADATGHLCLSTLTCTNEGWVFAKGDIITDIAGTAQNLKVIEARPVGHLNGRPNLLLVFFGNNDDTNPDVRG
jgi:hypothetical protein